MLKSTILCTYCSFEKNRAPGLIPSIRRYKSKRILKIYKLAKEKDLEFRILSGKYGLISADEKIPWYDHLLVQEEIDSLSEIISNQLKASAIDRVIYYTKNIETNPATRSYLSAIQVGCCKANVVLEIKIINGGNEMSRWREIMDQAEASKGQMISNRATGEETFRRLLDLYPADGMLYFKRGEAYEVLREFSNALNDFEKASILFPIEKWKLLARAAAERVKTEKDNVTTSHIPSTLVLDHRHLGEIYNSLRKLLSRIDNTKAPGEELHAQITRMESKGLIPSNIAVSMQTLRKYRNLAIKEGQQFSSYEADTIQAAWSAVKAWAKESGFKIDDLY